MADKKSLSDLGALTGQAAGNPGRRRNSGR